MNRDSSQYRQVVSEFAQHGAQIIKLDPRERYEHLGKAARRALEPGYIPTDEPPILTAISYYPNESTLPSTECAEAERAFRRWGATGGLSDYDEAYRGWQSFREQIPFYRRWEAPLFEALSVGSNETAWLPLIKCPLSADTKVEENGLELFKDLSLLWEQLNIVKPRIVLVQGAVVDNVVARAWAISSS